MKQFLRYYKSEINKWDSEFPIHIVDVVTEGRGTIGSWRVTAKERRYLAPVKNAMINLTQFIDD